MGRVRIRLYHGADKKIGKLPGVVPMLTRIAANVADDAKRLADSDRVARDIDVDSGYDEQGPLARVNANHWTSWFVEAGTSTQPPTAFLRRALESGRSL